MASQEQPNPNKTGDLFDASFLGRLRSRARRHLAEIKARRKVEEAPRTEAERIKASKFPRFPKEFYHEYAFVWRLWMFFRISVVFTFITFLLSMLALSIAKEKPVLAVKVPASPYDVAEATRTAVWGDQPFGDKIQRFAHFVLPILNGIDDTGNRKMSLLSGFVNPEIINAKLKRINRIGAKIKSLKLTQTVVITDIADLSFNERRGQINVAARGYVIVTQEPGGKRLAQIIPYRGEMTLDVLPYSRMNAFSLYLSRLEEKFGNDASGKEARG